MSGLDFYLSQLKEPLDKKTLQNLVEDWCKNHKEETRELLYEHNLGLVAGIVLSKYGDLPEDKIDDLIQEGNIALASSIDHYDIEKGRSFEYYASIRIHNRTNWFMKREAINQLHGIEEYREETLGMPKPSGTRSIDKFHEDGRIDLIEDFYESRIEEDYADKDLVERATKAIINRAHSKKEVDICLAYHGLDGEEPRSFGEIAKEHNISDGRVSQLYHKNMRRVEYELTKKGSR